MRRVIPGVPPPPRRPTAAFVLSLIGGVLIVMGGLVFLPLRGPFFFGDLALVGLASGIVVLVGSTLMFARPQNHAVGGLLALVFSAVSMVSLGGFVAGMVLGIVGGALGIAWNPAALANPAAPYPYGYYAGYAAPYGAPGSPYAAPISPFRMCMGCGRWIPWAANVCPYCGTQAPVAPPPVAPAPGPAPAPGAAASRMPCPTCHSEAEFLPVYGRWYCAAEQRYF